MANPRILKPTTANLAKLSKLQGSDRCVLTVYFPGSLDHGRELPASLSDLPAYLLPDEELTDDEEEHRRLSLDLWQASIPEVNLTPAPAWLGVVSWMTDHAVFMPLPATVELAAHLDDSPFLLPAGRLLDDFETYAVVYADHARATIYLAALGKLDEEARLRGDIKNHVRKGGWSQQRYERRRDKEIHRYCSAILERLKELVAEEDLRRIVLTGDRILLNQLEETLTPQLREMVVASLPLPDETEPREMFEKTLAAAAAEERREEKWLRGAISAEHAAGGRAVIGSPDTLKALKERRVRRLLLSSAYPQSAANDLLDLAFAGGSRVEFTDDPLEKFGGVAALLRW